MTYKLSSAPLFSRDLLQTRVQELGASVHAYYGAESYIVVGLMNGVFIFLADLVRAIPRSLELGFLKASSYGKSQVSSGTIHLDGMDRLDVAGRRVLLVDDILDTGRTLSHVQKALLQKGARDVRLCVLLDKPARRLVPCQADFCGFTIEDRFVVGYGLDCDEQFRNLPEIWEVIGSPLGMTNCAG